jgi:ArsR family transcriptional regulator
VNYRLADGTDRSYAANLLGSLNHWLDEDPGLADIVEKLPSIRREIICGS